MRVQILYFGVLNDLFGRNREERELAEGSTVGAMLNALSEEHSSEVWRTLAVAVNCEYVRSTTKLREGDEVALLPPVSGGRDAY